MFILVFFLFLYFSKPFTDEQKRNTATTTTTTKRPKRHNSNLMISFEIVFVEGLCYRIQRGSCARAQTLFRTFINQI
jgi:hypothetical protein